MDAMIGDSPFAVTSELDSGIQQAATREYEVSAWFESSKQKKIFWRGQRRPPAHDPLNT